MDVIHLIALKENQVFDLKRDRSYWINAFTREAKQSHGYRDAMKEAIEDINSGHPNWAIATLNKALGKENEE